ncbi:hypothetical protein ANAEL_00617 [Anaerolineales bacterium]|nr:hypothetical protein ANAEL_00617 [Anaerolineales bacterium]
MPIPCTIRVLVVDNDLKVRSQVVKILQGAGCLAQAAEGQGVELEESAKKLTSVFRPHIVIMDLRLSDEHTDDRSGLDLWKDQSFSSARCILYSAHLNKNYKITQQAFRQDGVEDVIGKEDSPQALVDAVKRVARMGCGCQNGLSLVWPTAWNEEVILRYLFGDDNDLPRDLVMDVLGRLFPETRLLALKPLEGAVETSVIVGHGRTVLFQAWPDNKEPVAVKLAPRERIQREVEAYKTYIQERLVGRFSAELHQHADFWDLGGICYSFMGSSQKSLKTFTTFYRQAKNSNEIIKPLVHFFEEVWSRHYSDSRQPLTGTLYQTYDPSHKLHQHLKDFPIQEKTVTFPGLPGTYVNPVVWLLTHGADSYFPHANQVIVHGDLHGDNLFVDEDHAWAIDFERSGISHILRDFVELEQNIITRLAILPEDDLQLFYYLAVILTKPLLPTRPLSIPKYFEENEEIKKALEVINGLRAIAQKVTHYGDLREYYWGLLLDASFGLMLSKMNSSRWWRAFLLSSLLCTRLKQWGENWPPVEWLSINEDQINWSNKIYEPIKENNHALLKNAESEFPGQNNVSKVTNIIVQGNISGSLTVGDGNRSIMDSYNKITSSKIDSELKETLRQLTEAVDMMSKSLSKEQLAEVADDLGRLVDEVTKPKPNKKWCSFSIEGLIKAAENVEKVGEPVINLSRKVLSLLTAGLVSP